MSDDPGLLGNLPRSRPGTRSDKRTTDAAAKPAAAKSAAAKPKARTKAKAKAPPKAKGRPKAKARAATKPRPAPKPRPEAKPRPKVANPKPRPAPESQSGDPVSEALKAAGRLAGAGARTANGVTREILRRLPRR